MLQTEQARREHDVRTLSLAHEDLQGKLERKDIRIDALVGQVAGLEWQIKQLRMENANEREHTSEDDRRPSLKLHQGQLLPQHRSSRWCCPVGALS